MKWTILGSGTAAPRLKRNMACNLLEANDLKVLFDTGAGSMRRLLENRTGIEGINYIFYTHLHNDHANDLPAIIWSNNYGLKRDKTLNLCGPRGFKKYLEMLLKKAMDVERLSYQIGVEEIKDGEEVNLKAKGGKVLKVKAAKSEHTDNSVSYRIEFDSKSLVYTGDTDFSQRLAKFALNADVLVAECSFPDKQKVRGHMTPYWCGKLATAAKAKKLVLTHIYPAADKADIVKQARKYYKGKVSKAKDFMQIAV